MPWLHGPVSAVRPEQRSLPTSPSRRAGCTRTRMPSSPPPSRGRRGTRSTLNRGPVKRRRSSRGASRAHVDVESDRFISPRLCQVPIPSTRSKLRKRSERPEQTSLPISSNVFRPSDGKVPSADVVAEDSREGASVPSRKDTVTRAIVRKDQDLSLKLQVASALATSGYYARINVGLSATSAKGLSDVTDIDVLGSQYDVTFNARTIAVSCKSG
jgi:hypothetical protein